MFSGKEFDGGTLGRADPYNNANDANAHAVAQMADGVAYSGYTDRCVLTAHEIGHNFGGLHEEAYQWTTSDPEIYHHTTMWSPFEDDYPNVMELEFSSDTDHGDATHDNIGIFEQTKDDVANYR